MRPRATPGCCAPGATAATRTRSPTRCASCTCWPWWCRSGWSTAPRAGCRTATRRPSPAPRWDERDPPHGGDDGDAARERASAPFPILRSPVGDAVRVAFLSATGRIGGAERALLDLLASLRAAEPGWALHLVVLGD